MTTVSIAFLKTASNTAIHRLNSICNNLNKAVNPYSSMRLSTLSRMHTSTESSSTTTSSNLSINSLSRCNTNPKWTSKVPSISISMIHWVNRSIHLNMVSCSWIVGLSQVKCRHRWVTKFNKSARRTIWHSLVMRGQCSTHVVDRLIVPCRLRISSLLTYRTLRWLPACKTIIRIRSTIKR